MGLSQTWFASQLGTGFTRSRVAKWKTVGTTELKLESLMQLTDLLCATVNYLLDLTKRMELERPIVNLIPIGTMCRVPVFGAIAAGQSLLAVKEVKEAITLPADIMPTHDVFALRVRGYSMIEGQIYEGASRSSNRRRWCWTKLLRQYW